MLNLRRYHSSCQHLCLIAIPTILPIHKAMDRLLHFNILSEATLCLALSICAVVMTACTGTRRSSCHHHPGSTNKSQVSNRTVVLATLEISSMLLDRRSIDRGFVQCSVVSQYRRTGIITSAFRQSIAHWVKFKLIRHLSLVDPIGRLDVVWLWKR